MRHVPGCDLTADDASVIAAMRTWLERAVIGLNLCPFAKAVHVKQQIRYVVSHATDTDTLLDELERELKLIAVADPQQIDTTLLIHPQVLGDFLDFHFFLPTAERMLKDLGLEGVLQVASFHPQFEFADADPEDMGNYTNRAPFATLHLLREASLDRAVAAFPDAADIYERNIATLQRLGHAGWKKLFIPD